jgi:signal transduction histidine kinase
LITAIRSNGEPVPVSELGERAIARLEFPHNRAQLEIEYVTPYFAGGQSLLYETKLDGATSVWSAPSPNTSLNFANLAPGTYRFQVRAVAPGGLSGDSASLDFEILSPVWRRWWFVSFVVALLAAAAAAAHRYRVNQVIELQRVRARIATDLHDDLGSGLSQVAILSEMIRKRLDGAAPAATEPLSRIATVSRELIESMEDIVWSINPARDRLQDLSSRMRQFASEVLEPRGIDLAFGAPEAGRDVALDPAIRRHLYLIFKEAIHNLRHSGCSAVVVRLTQSVSELLVEVRDNGRGMERANDRSGHGLASMRSRAEACGGSLEVESGSGGGVVRARIPLRQKAYKRR